MNKMTSWFKTGFILISISVLPAFTLNSGRGDIISASILIQGRTNVNRFELKYTATDFEDLSSLFRLKITDNVLTGSLVVPVRDFKSKPEKVRDDFLRLTDAGKNPFITIRLLQDISLPAGHIYTVLPVSVMMAGNSNTYPVNCRIERTDENSLLFEGQQTISLTDYGIDPPEKVVGMIKVENDLVINFSVNFTVTEQLFPKKSEI